MASGVRERNQSEATVGLCQHHWVVEAPSGVESRGVCRKCGAIRGFRNATQDFVWEAERSADLAFWAMSNAPRAIDGEGSAA